MKKNSVSNIVLIIIFLIGLSLLLYPSLSDYWNSFHQSQAISSYVEKIAELDDDQYSSIWEAAHRYNTSLYQNRGFYKLEDSEREEYEQLLNVAENGVMGYIEIPEVDCTLPIYHGTDEAVLQIAIGHLEWSSLPIGGINTHCIVSGHRGLPSARLFTDLDQLIEGDIFMIRVLDEVISYEVDQIRIVLPNEVDELNIVEGGDYCTLVTCTPYGVNSHRLLVRGHRVDNLEIAESIRVPADAVQVEPILVAPILSIPIFVILLIYLIVRYRTPKKKK